MGLFWLLVIILGILIIPALFELLAVVFVIVFAITAKVVFELKKRE